MKSAAFTLVELMVVIAIVLVLAAVAIPAVHEYSLKAKIAEGPVNQRGIVVALKAYEAALDGLPADGAYEPRTPNADLTKGTAPWTTGDPDWLALDWEPDGEVYCAYQFRTPPTFVVNVSVDYQCDTDGDGNEIQHRQDFNPQQGWSIELDLVSCSAGSVCY